MKAKGLFMYKGIQKREKGSFTNQETGEVIEYGSCYILVVDEIEENGKITERRFKVAEDNGFLINEFSTLESYTKVEIEFDVTLYSSNAKVVPSSFELV